MQHSGGNGRAVAARRGVGKRFLEQDGSVLVNVSVMMVALAGMSALALDAGMMYVNRTEIQRTADAAALGAAAAVAYDTHDATWSYDSASAAAQRLGAINTVMSQTASLTAADVDQPVCPDWWEGGPFTDPHRSCVEVTAYRSLSRSNPVQLLFARIFGLETADVTARAVGQAKRANASRCLMPFVVPDRWLERYPVPGSWDNQSFERYDPAAPTVPLADPDDYEAPWELAAGSGPGLEMPTDLGTQVVIRHGAVGSAPRQWHYVPVEIPGSAQGISHQANIEGCANALVTIGDRLPVVTSDVEAATAAGVQSLIARDPGATWNTATKAIDGSCVATSTPCGAISPRIVTIGLYDPGDVADQNALGGTADIVVRNIIALFISSADATTLTGYIVRGAGEINPNMPMLLDTSTFLRKIVLVE